MEWLLTGIAGLVGVALFAQAKALPNEADYKKASEKLIADPNDADANTVVGKYLCFVQGDYKLGLPFLSRSANKNLKALAEHELTPGNTDTALQKIGMGDEWVTAAKSFKPLYRTFYDRASSWYVAAWPDLEGIWKDKLRERFKKLLLLPAPGGSRPGLPAAWSSGLANVKAAVDGTVAHAGAKSLRVDLTRDKPAYFFVQSPVYIAPKGAVTASMWVATDGTDSAQEQFVVNYYSATGALIGKSVAFIPVDAPYWQKVEVKAEVPKDAVRFLVEIGIHSTKGTIWADDFSMKDASGKEFVDNGSFEK